MTDLRALSLLATPQEAGGYERLLALFCSLHRTVLCSCHRSASPTSLWSPWLSHADVPLGAEALLENKWHRCENSVSFYKKGRTALVQHKGFGSGPCC